MGHAVQVGVAALSQGALITGGVGGGALGGTEVHHGLVEEGRVGIGHLLAGDPGDLLPGLGDGNVLADAEMAADDAHHVAIHGGVGQPEGKGGNGRGSIVAHPL